MNLKDTFELVCALPAKRSIMLEGPTGVGKSSLTRAIAKEFNLRYLDIRLGQMQEGDLALPHVHKVGESHVTDFAIAKWFKEASSEACLICFEELNRAPSVGVLQQVFQVFLDRELHGVKLHPETRIMSCINVGSEYQVLELDPALLQRFYRVSYMPTKKEWLKHASAEEVMHTALHSFLSQSTEFIDFELANDPMEVVPSRRGWFDVGQDTKDLIQSVMTERAKEKPSKKAIAKTSKLIRHLLSSRVGETAAIAFTQYLESKRIYSPEDVFLGNQDEIFNDMTYVDLNLYTEQVVELVKAYALKKKRLPSGITKKEALARWSAFVDRLTDETVVALWKAHFGELSGGSPAAKDWVDATLQTVERASDVLWKDED